MEQAVKVSTIISSVALAVIIISADCYARSIFRMQDRILDMANNSVDDQFIDCYKQTYNRIEESILPQELKSNSIFRQLWIKYSNISDKFTRIIKMYTDLEELYSDLNDKVSSGRKGYISTFNYKTVHFLLTHAIQMFKVENCTDVFRRTDVEFERPDLGQEMRFGRFTSTSLLNNISDFGSTCFKINTCLGANIANMSEFPDEEEVLIPPFEKFNITNITTAENEMNCSVLYTLQSTGNFSNMNCELIRSDKKPLLVPQVGHFLLPWQQVDSTQLKKFRKQNRKKNRILYNLAIEYGHLYSKQIFT